MVDLPDPERPVNQRVTPWWPMLFQRASRGMPVCSTMFADLTVPVWSLFVYGKDK